MHVPQFVYDILWEITETYPHVASRRTSKVFPPDLLAFLRKLFDAVGIECLCIHPHDLGCGGIDVTSPFLPDSAKLFDFIFSHLTFLSFRCSSDEFRALLDTPADNPVGSGPRFGGVFCALVALNLVRPNRDDSVHGARSARQRAPGGARADLLTRLEAIGREHRGVVHQSSLWVLLPAPKVPSPAEGALSFARACSCFEGTFGNTQAQPSSIPSFSFLTPSAAQASRNGLL